MIFDLFSDILSYLFYCTFILWKLMLKFIINKNKAAIMRMQLRKIGKYIFNKAPGFGIKRRIYET